MRNGAVRGLISGARASIGLKLTLACCCRRGYQLVIAQERERVQLLGPVQRSGIANEVPRSARES